VRSIFFLVNGIENSGIGKIMHELLFLFYLSGRVIVDADTQRYGFFFFRLSL
jgi:hypothetical protein